MSVLFSAGEFINVAIQIERNGFAFYQSLEKSARDPRICTACGLLAGMEQEHIKLFEGMLETVADHSPADTYDEEYDRYLRSLVDSVVFSSDRARTMAGRGAGNAEALEFALGAEKDSIVFYSEMRHLVPERERRVVDRIIAEEKSHLAQLADLRREIAGREKG